MSGFWIAEMTRLRARGYEVRFLEVLIIFCYPIRPDRLISVDYSSLGMKLTTSTEVRNEWSYTFTLPVSIYSTDEDNFILVLRINVKIPYMTAFCFVYQAL